MASKQQPDPTTKWRDPKTPKEKRPPRSEDAEIECLSSLATRLPFRIERARGFASYPFG